MSKAHEDRLAELNGKKTLSENEVTEKANIEKYLASLKVAPKVEEPKAEKKTGKKSKKA